MELLSTSLGQPHEAMPKARLACEACQRRKIKCDRNLPCEQCRRKKSPCVPVVNNRLPRGRNGGRGKLNGDLTTRIAKLESLLTQAQPKIEALVENPKANASATGLPEHVEENDPPSQSQYLGGAFWTSMKEELSKLQGDIENSTPSTEPIDDLDEDLSSPCDQDASLGGAGLEPIGAYAALSILLVPPPPILARALCGIYFTNVDPVFKVLHAPSVRRHIEEYAPYLDHMDGDRSVTALRFVVYYAALSTGDDAQCMELCGQHKAQAVAQYRRMAEAALAQADYLVSNDLTTLQALVVFLGIRRHEDQTRRTWTLLSLAFRSALAMRLHTEGQGDDAFTAQQRSRLWHALCVLDLHMAVDLASDTLINPGTYNSHLPLNINDSDIEFESHRAVIPRLGWTDMTFSLMRRQIAHDAHRSYHLESSRLQGRQDIITSMRATIETHFLAYCKPNIPLHAFTIAVGRSTGAACLLHSMRPTKASASATASAVGSEHVLQIAVEALSYARQGYEDPSMAGWQWVTWRQWHALAVAFAALSFITEGPLADSAWPVIEEAFSHFTSNAGDAKQTQLSRPLSKLARRAREARAHVLQNRPSGVTTLSHDTGASGASPLRWEGNADAAYGNEPMTMEELNTWSELLEDFPDPMEFGLL